MQVGDLVGRGLKRHNTIGIVAKVSKDKKTIEVRWLKGKYLTRLQYAKDIEVINESR